VRRSHERVCSQKLLLFGYLSMYPPVYRPTRKQVTQYYKTHRSQFRMSEQVHVLQIVKNLDGITDRERASAIMRKALDELSSGVPFSQVADQYSDCPGNGGYLGWVERGVMVEEFENVVFNLPRETISAVFETRFGFHIVLVTERRGPGILPMSAVYDQIVEFLSTRRAGRGGFA
jgi:parvulin-like peptidyl-prolyl isomerase